MFKLTDPQYGKAIKLNNETDKIGGNAMISQFLNMKRNYRSRLESISGGDIHAKRFFCKNDCAYIFSLNVLESLVASIKKHGGDSGGAVVLFQALRKDGVPKVDPKDYHFGRPTIIAVPYKAIDGHLERIPVSFENKEQNNSGEYDGFEHPGDGTSGKNIVDGNESEKDFSTDFTSPVVSRPLCNPDCDVDYKVMDKITDLEGFKF